MCGIVGGFDLPQIEKGLDAITIVDQTIKELFKRIMSILDMSVCLLLTRVVIPINHLSMVELP